MTVVKDSSESVAKLSGKRGKRGLKRGIMVKQKAKCDKSTKSAARNLSREHVWIITELSGLTSEAICEFVDVPLCLFNAMFRLLVWKPDFGGNLLKTIIKSRYIGHFLIIGQNIGIDMTLP